MHDPEAESRPSDPARDPAAADLAHELGNRLAAIIAFSHLIRTDPRLPDDLHDQAALLEEEADRTRKLVEQLLASARPRSTTPRSAGGREAAAPSPGPDRPILSARILVLDDEPSIRDFLERVLRRLGYDPVIASTGDEALAVVRSDAPPDAILSDHRMAGMTGAAFHEAVRAESPELAARFAFMSGNVADPTIQELAADRGVILLSKPFDLDEVASTVAELLGDDDEADGA